MSNLPPLVLLPSLPLDATVDSKPPGNSNSFTHWPPSYLFCIARRVCDVTCLFYGLHILPALVGEVGIEPTSPKATDLQSADLASLPSHP